jgi:hypothetical protein
VEQVRSGRLSLLFIIVRNTIFDCFPLSGAILRRPLRGTPMLCIVPRRSPMQHDS